MHTKKTLIASFLLGLGLTTLHAQTMYVKENSGTQTAYALNSIEKLSFSSGNLTVSKTTGSPVNYPLSGVRYLNFNNTTGIPMAENPNGTMLLYPNPVADWYNIELATMGNLSGTIEILSIEGKIVRTQTLNSKTNIEQVNVSGLPQGLYLCRVNNGTTLITTKFFKQ